MAHTTRFTPHGIEIKITGSVTPVEAAEIHESIRRHKFPQALKWELVDLSKAVGHKITSAVIERAAEKDREFLASNPKFAIAFIASNPLLFGFARMYEGYMGDAVAASRVFEARPPAIAWLCEHGATLDEFPEG